MAQAPELGRRHQRPETKDRRVQTVEGETVCVCCTVCGGWQLCLWSARGGGGARLQLHLQLRTLQRAKRWRIVVSVCIKYAFLSLQTNCLRAWQATLPQRPLLPEREREIACCLSATLPHCFAFAFAFFPLSLHLSRQNEKLTNVAVRLIRRDRAKGPPSGRGNQSRQWGQKINVSWFAEWKAARKL